MEFIGGTAIIAITSWLIDLLKKKFKVSGASAYWLAIVVSILVAIPATFIAGEWGWADLSLADPMYFLEGLARVVAITFAGSQVLFNGWKALLEKR